MQQDNWNAKDYANHSKAQEIWAKELITKLDLKGDEAILDLGCGDGKITNILNDSTKNNVIGVDKNKAMVTFATASYHNITFYQMDATKLTFENKFDIVFSNAVLHWISDQKAVLRGVYRALKPKGKILLQFGGYGNAKTILEVMDKFITNSSYTKYFKNFKSPYYFPHPKKYNQFLKDTKFKEYDTKLIQKDMIHQNIKAFKGWIRTTWFPYTNALPKELREEFMDEFIRSYLDIIPLDNKNRVHVNMTRLEVKAIK